MKHDDLWNDTLSDALPDALQANSLAMMKREAGRLRTRRRIVRTSAAMAALFMLGWLALPKTEPASRSAITTPAVSKPTTPQVRYLNDTELITRLRDAGIGIGIAGSGDQKRLLLVSHDGAIYRP